MIKKCLYINDNKAIIRNKELQCIADILQDNNYKNIYGELNLNYYILYIDLGIITYCINSFKQY
jgi:hypothetical protein